jgi:hypothetical protein
MQETVHNTEPSFLWECLHDGGIEKLISDLAARTLAIVVDSSFHWEFHKLSADTRFKVIGEGVRSIEVFEFEPWPDAVEPPQSTPWEQAKEIRKQNYEKGRLVSVSWSEFAEQVSAGKEYDILNAELYRADPIPVLKLEVLEITHTDYREIKIHAEDFRYFVGERELSLEQFQEFGSAYWDDFAKRAEEFKRDGAN